MIDQELAAFLQEGVGIHIATRNAALQPNGARALAVTVDADGTHVVVYVAEAAAARILPDLEANGQVAIGFGRPIDDRACQVKGVFVGARAATEAERAAVCAQWNGFLGSLELIGIPRAATQAWVTWPAVAIRLRANALFNQTPGPHAGAPIA
jgi:Pyridoxamine 5'-phosphate oxidase